MFIIINILINSEVFLFFPIPFTQRHKYYLLIWYVSNNDWNSWLSVGVFAHKLYEWVTGFSFEPPARAPPFQFSLLALGLLLHGKCFTVYHSNLLGPAVIYFLFYLFVEMFRDDRIKNQYHVDTRFISPWLDFLISFLCLV